MLNYNDPFAITITVPTDKLRAWGETAAAYFTARAEAAQAQEDSEHAAPRRKGGLVPLSYGAPLSSYYKGLAIRTRSLLIALSVTTDETAKVPLSLVTMLSTPEAWDEVAVSNGFAFA